MEGYEKFWFLKGWCGVFLKDQFDIMSSSTAFDESWEWQFRDWSLRAGVAGQALLSWWIKFVCLLRCTQRAVAEWRSQHTPGFARVCVSWETSRGPTDSDNEQNLRKLELSFGIVAIQVDADQWQNETRFDKTADPSWFRVTLVPGETFCFRIFGAKKSKYFSKTTENMFVN